MTETLELNAKVKINDISFILKRLKIEDNNIQFSKVGYQYITVSNSKNITIYAESDNLNYMKIGNLFEISNKKTDLILKNLRLYGVFLIDYNFNQYNINVTFSAQYMDGDILAFKKNQIRKEKLKKINEYSTFSKF